MGPHWGMFFLTQMVIVTAVTLFSIYVEKNWIIRGIAFAMTVVSLFFHIRTGTTDPGYISRQERPPQHVLEHNLAQQRRRSSSLKYCSRHDFQLVT